MNRKPRIVCLMGPTASGKTDLAVELVKHFPMDIISVDSTLIYKGMDIGTAKPDAATLQQAPHRLIDFLDPATAYSVAEFRDDALTAIGNILQMSRIPLLVGGTMMYFKALLEGLADLPPADPVIREALLQEAQRHGWAHLHERLSRIDPESAARIHPNDPQRLQRALEVYEVSGVPLSSWLAQPVNSLAYEAIRIALVPSDRSWLHERIARRFDIMLQQGLIAEVQKLYARGDLHTDLPAVRAVGYRQVWQYLAGELDEFELRERGIIATRQLAKRQLTWLRSMPDTRTFDCLNKDLVNEVLNFLGQNHISA